MIHDCGQSLGVNLDWTRKAGCENKQTLPELKSRQTIQRCKHLSPANKSVQSKSLLRQHHLTSSLSPSPPFPHFISGKCLCGHAIYKPHKSTKLLHSAKGFPSQISFCKHHSCFPSHEFTSGKAPEKNSFSLKIKKSKIGIYLFTYFVRRTSKSDFCIFHLSLFVFPLLAMSTSSVGFLSFCHCYI